MKICGKLQCQHYLSLEVSQGAKVEGTFIHAVVAMLTLGLNRYAPDMEHETVVACFHHTKGQRDAFYPVGECVNRVLIFCSPVSPLVQSHYYFLDTKKINK